MMLYPLMIATGLALLAVANLITSTGARVTVSACSFAAFLVAVIAALVDGGVFH